MITSINPKNYVKYSLFFNEAWEALHTEHRITDEEYAMGAPTTLEEYFVYADELKGLTDTLGKTKYKYLMLPLDEPPFEIDANTRKISIPTNFAKNGVGVQGDVIAETLFFRIDRFFDYMDLLTTDIYVQWKTASKEDNHGVTRINTVDYESQADQGKMLLAWPLHEKVCATPGALQFSVRFIKREGGTGAITYSLNTLPATITINAALKSDMDYAEQDDPSDLFSSAISSSPSTVGPTPDIPAFTPTGLDLPNEAYLNNNTYTFKVQATTNDNSNIIYEWHHVVGVQDNALEDGVQDVFEMVVNPEAPTADNEKVYYVQDETVPKGYKEYAGEIFPPQAADGTEIPVYARYSTYTIADSEESVVGTYYAVAKNKRQKATGAAKHGLSMKESSRCLMPAPETLTLTDLDAYQFIENDIATLTTTATTDNPKSTLTYTLYRSVSAADSGFEVKNSAESNTFTVQEPGWYYINSEATLNRATIEDNTTVCKVVEVPVAPKVYPATEDEMDEENLNIVNCQTDQIVQFPLRVSMPDGVTITPFNHEQFEYVWEKKAADSDEWVTMVAGVDTEASGLGSNTLTIRYNGAPATYRCKVTNIIGSRASEAAYSGAMLLYTKN